MRTVVVLAGGLGTRIASLTGDSMPKALLPVAGLPFLAHKLSEISRLGGERVVLLLGHRADPIVEFVGNGSRWNLEIAIVRDGGRLRGTGGAVKWAAPVLPEQFWLTYGDTLLDADLERAEHDEVMIGAAGTMTVLHNRDRWQVSNVSVDERLVVAYDKHAVPGRHDYIDYGYLHLPASAIMSVPVDEFDLSVALEPLIASRSLAAAVVSEPFHDIGTPDALAETERWLRTTPRESTG
jgi:MurNAc alpha-1-phosphate uridylyltransferase